MREIKFRAKHKVLGWKYGTVLYTANDDMWQLVDENSVFYEINRETLGQFTGLYDKNKVPIYEGDIVELKANNGCCDMTGQIIFDEYDKIEGIYDPNPILKGYPKLDADGNSPMIIRPSTYKIDDNHV